MTNTCLTGGSAASAPPAAATGASATDHPVAGSEPPPASGPEPAGRVVVAVALVSPALTIGDGGCFTVPVIWHGTLTNEASTGMSGVSVRTVEKSSTSARFRALASRNVRGARPQRHSI